MTPSLLLCFVLFQSILAMSVVDGPCLRLLLSLLQLGKANLTSLSERTLYAAWLQSHPRREKRAKPLDTSMNFSFADSPAMSG